MLSRRNFILSALAAGAAAGTYGLYRAKHTLPPPDPAAEERFRQLQDALLAHNGISAVSRFFNLTDPGLRVHVIEAGAGEPVLFVHGGNSVAASWTPLLARFHSRFHLYAPDRPGCGLTTKFSYIDVALRPHAVAFLCGVMDSLSLSRAALVANSMGGYFSLVFALAHPQRVSKLVLIGEPAGSAPTSSLSHRMIGTRILNTALYLTVLKPGPEAVRNGLKRLRVANLARVPGDYLECLTAGAMIPGAVESWLTMVERAFSPPGAGLLHGASTLTYALRPELSTLQPPTLFLWGERDPFGPPKLGQEMARLVPVGRCEVIPEAGHLPWLDQPDLCARLIESFLG